MRTVTFSVFTPSERMPEAYKYLLFKDIVGDIEHYGYFSSQFNCFVVTGINGERTDVRTEYVKEWRYISEKDEAKFSNTIQKGNIL